MLGSILCSFERDERSEQREGHPALVIRVVKIVRPIQIVPGYDGWVPMPKEGQLLHSRPKKPEAAWSCNTEQASRCKVYAALKPLLEDA